MGDGIERYGQATYVGDPSDARSLAAAGRLYGSSDVGSAAAAGLVVQGIANHHLIGDYAADLGVTLPNGRPGAGSGLSAADIEGALSTITGGRGGLDAGSIESLFGEHIQAAQPDMPSMESVLGATARPHGHFG